jgi:hypothetical protein
MVQTVSCQQLEVTALKDLSIVVHEMLGQGLRELRLEEREDRQKFIAEIHEAVINFQSEAKTCRQNLQATSANDKEEDGKDTESACSWELKYIDILPKYQM